MDKNYANFFPKTGNKIIKISHTRRGIGLKSYTELSKTFFRQPPDLTGLLFADSFIIISQRHLLLQPGLNQTTIGLDPGHLSRQDINNR